MRSMLAPGIPKAPDDLQSRKGSNRVVASVAVAVVIVVAAAAIGLGGRTSTTSRPVIGLEPAAESPPPTVPVTSGDIPTEGTGIEIVDTDWIRDSSFWSSMVSFAGLEVEHHSSVAAMAESATAVIVGQVIEVVNGQELSDPDTGEPTQDTMLRVAVIDLLRGALPVGGATVDIQVFAIPDGLVTGPALIFLRWKGEGYEDGSVVAPPDIEAADRLSYRLVSSQGVFIPGPEGEARNPLSEAMNGFLDDQPDVLADPVAREVLGLTWDDLVESLAG